MRLQMLFGKEAAIFVLLKHKVLIIQSREINKINLIRIVFCVAF